MKTNLLHSFSSLDAACACGANGLFLKNSLADYKIKVSPYKVNVSYDVKVSHYDVKVSHQKLEIRNKNMVSPRITRITRIEL